MTTKPPQPIIEYSPDSLEKIAYRISGEIPVQEINDGYRLGYCLWCWLSERRGSLRQAIHASGTRTSLTPEELYDRISSKLQENGIRIS